MSTRRARDRERGIALLMVLWVFMILGVLSLDFSRYMRDDAMAAVNFADGTRGYYEALAGMNHALFDAMIARDQGGAPKVQNAGIGHDDEDREGELVPADGQWHDGTFGGGKYQVRITDESGRVPINTVTPEQLRRIVTNVMMGPNSAVQGMNTKDTAAVDEVVDAIIDWRDPDSLKSPKGAESDYYLSNRGYPAKNAYFDDINELLQVRGVTAELFYGVDGGPGLRDVFSVYNLDPDLKLNARTVTSPVIQVLLNKTPEEADEMIAQRDDDLAGFSLRFQSQLIAVDPSLEGLVGDKAATLVFVEARADTSDPRNQANVAAVVNLSSDEYEGPKIIRWFDRAPWRGTLPTAASFGEPAA
jgi:type II secretory pathway component PulK